MRIRYEYGRGEAIEVEHWSARGCEREFQALLSKLAPWKDLEPPKAGKAGKPS